MKLQTIIQQTAGRMHNVTVHVVSIMGTVTICDANGEQEDIFLQGDDASVFISERERLWNETGDLDRGTIDLFLAEPYTVLWS